MLSTHTHTEGVAINSSTRLGHFSGVARDIKIKVLFVQLKTNCKQSSRGQKYTCMPDSVYITHTHLHTYTHPRPHTHTYHIHMSLWLCLRSCFSLQLFRWQNCQWNFAFLLRSPSLFLFLSPSTIHVLFLAVSALPLPSPCLCFLLALLSLVLLLIPASGNFDSPRFVWPHLALPPAPAPYPLPTRLLLLLLSNKRQAFPLPTDYHNCQSRRESGWHKTKAAAHACSLVSLFDFQVQRGVWLICTNHLKAD